MQPVGLVVSIPALLDVNVRINRNFGPDHQRFLSALPTNAAGEPVPEILDIAEFAQAVFGWSIQDLYGAAGAPAVPDSLEAPLPEHNETLRPTYALREFQPKIRSMNGFCWSRCFLRKLIWTRSSSPTRDDGRPAPRLDLKGFFERPAFRPGSW